VRPAIGSNPFRSTIEAFVDACRTRTFWLLLATFFICGLTTNGLVQTHLIPAAHDHGITEVTAAGLLALIGLFDIVGATASGWLTDRHDARVLLFWYYGLRGLSLLALPFLFSTTHSTLVIFAVFYGLDWAATVPPTIAITASTFGQARTGILFAWVFGAHQLGAALAAQLGGTIRTLAGNYDWAFYAGGILAIVASFLVVAIRTIRVAPAPQPAGA
jgi:predicted MFS family arabinose efflux permease